MEKTFHGSAGSRYTTYDLKETLNKNVIEFFSRLHNRINSKSKTKLDN